MSRIKIADDIIANHDGEGEADAEILLCCGISALAAQMWPGEAIDRKRLVQFLVQFASPSLSITKIIVPWLANKLEERGVTDGAIKMRHTYLPLLSEMLDADEDKDEWEVMATLPSLARKEIRGCSYASSIYTDLRSGLIHEFQLSSHLMPYTFSIRTDIPSYVNIRTTIPDPIRGKLFVDSETGRYLHFPCQFIRIVAESAASAAFAYWETQNSLNQLERPIWWTEGLIFRFQLKAIDG